MIFILIVIYNKRIIDSLSYNSLKMDNSFNFIIFDNSKSEYINFNKKFCQLNSIKYYTLNKNVGLSKAYNYVVDKIEKNYNNYLVILDDDTPLTNEYVTQLKSATKEAKYDVYLPVIYSHNKIISPANVQFNCRIKMLNNLKELKMDKISAINSGMVIRTEVFKEFNYNENMFLEYIDHDFMKKIRNYKKTVQLMNTTLEQNYSRFQYNKVENELFRFAIYLNDFKIYCKDCHNLLFYYISTLKYRLTECIKYKTIKFLFIK